MNKIILIQIFFISGLIYSQINVKFVKIKDFFQEKEDIDLNINLKNDENSKNDVLKRKQYLSSEELLSKYSLYLIIDGNEYCIEKELDKLYISMEKDTFAKSEESKRIFLLIKFKNKDECFYSVIPFIYDRIENNIYIPVFYLRIQGFIKKRKSLYVYKYYLHNYYYMHVISCKYGEKTTKMIFYEYLLLTNENIIFYEGNNCEDSN